MKSVDYIISAKNYGGSGKKYIQNQQHLLRAGKGITVPVLRINNPTGAPVYARIWKGQWIADCEYCNGASFIDPDEPVFFCFGCGNRANASNCRPVIIPENWKEIENVLLERPVDDIAGLTDNERAGLARPVLFVERDIDGHIVQLPLVRSWEHYETVDDLHAQQDDAIDKWKKSKDKEVTDGIQ